MSGHYPGNSFYNTVPIEVTLYDEIAKSCALTPVYMCVLAGTMYEYYIEYRDFFDKPYFRKVISREDYVILKALEE